MSQVRRALELTDKKNQCYSRGKRFRCRFLASSANESVLRIEDRSFYN